MAKLKVFSVYDSKMEAYARPFNMLTQGLALRAFIAAVNDPQTELSKHPEDFSLFFIAEYDEATGTYENTHTPISIAQALEYHEGKKTYQKVNDQ